MLELHICEYFCIASKNNKITEYKFLQRTLNFNSSKLNF